VSFTFVLRAGVKDKTAAAFAGGHSKSRHSCRFSRCVVWLELSVVLAVAHFSAGFIKDADELFVCQQRDVTSFDLCDAIPDFGIPCGFHFAAAPLF